MNDSFDSLYEKVFEIPFIVRLRFRAENDQIFFVPLFLTYSDCSFIFLNT